MQWLQYVWCWVLSQCESNNNNDLNELNCIMQRRYSRCRWMRNCFWCNTFSCIHKLLKTKASDKLWTWLIQHKKRDFFYTYSLCIQLKTHAQKELIIQHMKVVSLSSYAFFCGFVFIFLLIIGFLTIYYYLMCFVFDKFSLRRKCTFFRFTNHRGMKYDWARDLI